jgi:hypothetical protein
MSAAEQELLEKCRSLPVDKQQQVLEFVEFLHLKTVNSQFNFVTQKRGWMPGFFEEVIGGWVREPNETRISK